MTFRSDLDALEARHSALTDEVTRRTEERDRAAALLEDARARARLPILDNIKVASPCTASWEAMVGDDRMRHCAGCDKDVYNLSNMTREEAQALITERHGRLCARFYKRADGTIMTADCSVGVRQGRKRKLLAVGVAIAAAAGGAGAYRAITGAELQGNIEEMPAPSPEPIDVKVMVLPNPVEPPVHQVFMGDISPAAIPPPRRSQHRPRAACACGPGEPRRCSPPS
jgi:hypothetical protein